MLIVYQDSAKLNLNTHAHEQRNEKLGKPYDVSLITFVTLKVYGKYCDF